jgi:hypothetical protein
MHSARFEPTITASEGPQAHALDRAAIGIGQHLHNFCKLPTWAEKLQYVDLTGRVWKVEGRESKSSCKKGLTCEGGWVGPSKHNCRTQLLLQQMHTFIIKSTRYQNLYFISYILPLYVSTRVGHLQGAQCQCLAEVIINYNLLKLC